MIRTDGRRTVSNVPLGDYRIRDEGTVVLLWPISDEADAWCDEHLPKDRIRWGGAAVIEHRYAGPIIEALASEGLVGVA
jgi:hypothetical protein